MIHAPTLLHHLRAAIAKSGTQAAWARENRVSPSYLNDVLGGKRDPGGKIARALGYTRVCVFVRITGESDDE